MLRWRFSASKDEILFRMNYFVEKMTNVDGEESKYNIERIRLLVKVRSKSGTISNSKFLYFE